MDLSLRASVTPWLAARYASFVYAFRGLSCVFRESNARIHAAATAVAIAAAVLLRITTEEWALIVFAIAAVWVTEALNTALERLADAAVPQRHPLVGAAKDVAASA